MFAYAARFAIHNRSRVGGQRLGVGFSSIRAKY